MSNLSRFISVAKQAKQALDARNSGSGAAAGAPSGQTDWRDMVRKAADTITGDGRTAPTASTPAPVRSAAPVSADDRAAIARYDYLLQTADPAAIEQVHRDAFERLTPAQREQIEQRMRAELPAHEQPRSAEPSDLARTATRAELSSPGMLKGLLSRVGGGGGRNALMGGAAVGVGVAAGGMLAAVAGGAILSSVAGPLLEQAANIGVDFDALGGALDLEGLTGGLGESVSGLGESVGGLGDQVSGLGEQVGGWNLPGLDDIFGR